MKGSQGSFASFFPTAAAAVCAAALGATAVGATALGAQGVTTASVTGRVTGPGGAPLQDARVTAVHLPSGTTYNASTRADGRYTILGMRVGGPYRVTARALGYAPQVREGVSLSLGTAADLSFSAERVAAQLSEVTVTAQTTGTISSTRTGAATAVSREAIQTLPTISRTIGDFTRLTPQASGTSFAGQDNRLNNITVDGSFFNNSFGLGSQPGGRTGVSPIPLDAIDQIQVNVAPFDVRQGNFVGANVNAVTRSGTNEFEGSVYYFGRDQRFVGRFADVGRVNPGTFDFGQFGARLGGPIVRDRLFFFVNFEDDQLSEPGTTFEVNPGGVAPSGNITRVSAADLDSLSRFLANRFGYQTGPYAGYSNLTPSRRVTAKLDYNVSERHKASLRYTQLDSRADNLVSNSNSLGFGNRRTNQNSISFQNSGYGLLENIRSLVGEVNSQFGGRVANNLIVGYTSNDESRELQGSFFPTVDILRDGVTYTSFGLDPFTPSNQLRYNTFQFQNNLSVFTAKHELTFGVSAQRYRSENVFFSGANSVYTYNSLDDFYRDANDFLANPDRATSPVTLRRFEVRYNNIPGQAEPLQPLRVLYAGAYAQDEWRATDNLRLTLGLRADVPRFESTGLANAQANALAFRDENGNAVRYSTEKLPNANVLFSPRFGLNWDVRGDKSTQLRGGTGIFSGSPAFVWISNQIGENGIQTGFERSNNVTNRPFNPDPDAYKQAPTGQPAAQYQLALTDPDFRFPQVWRSNLALDQRLPGGVVATFEGLYGRDVNGVYYINANLAEPNAQFAGPDARPRWVNDAATPTVQAARINQNIDNAVVLKNQNVGTSWNAAVSLEKAFRGGFFAKAAYSYGEARNTVDPGSIAFGSWVGNPHAGDPNNPGLGYSVNSPGHRAFVAASYKGRILPLGETGVSLFAERRTIANTSYTFSGDLNGDGGTSNDLIYIPRDRSEMNFEQFTASGRTFTAAEQADAWEAYIQQDEYLRDNRGRYAQRGAVFLPQVLRADLSVTQDISRALFGRRNALQLRLDILNFGNLLARDWGVGQRLVTNTPLVIGANRPTADAQGRAVYRLRNFGNQLLAPRTFERAAGLGDVYRFQLGARYTFGN